MRRVGAVVVAALLAVSGVLVSGCASHAAPEVAFAQDMAAHHAQAVEMATIMLERLDPQEDRDLWAISTDIVLTQSNQIGRFQAWLDAAGEPMVGSSGHAHGGGAMPGMASPEDVASLRSLPLGQARERYVALMVAHHRGGVEMAQAALDEGLLSAAERVARSIVTGQSGEIVALESALRSSAG